MTFYGQHRITGEVMGFTVVNLNEFLQMPSENSVTVYDEIDAPRWVKKGDLVWERVEFGQGDRK